MTVARWVLLILTLEGFDAAIPQSFPPSISVKWRTTQLCPGGDNALTTTEVFLYYDYTQSGITFNETVLAIKKNSTGATTYCLNYSSINPNVMQDVASSMEARYYFEQKEHGGGWCNCVDISFQIRGNNTKLV